MVLEESSEKIESNIIESNLDFAEQASINIDQTLYQVNDLSLFIFQDRNIFEFLNLPAQSAGEDVDRLTTRIYRTLMFFMNRGMGVTSLTIRGANGLAFSINPLDDNFDFLTGEIYNKIISLDGEILWLPVSSERLSHSRLLKNQYDLDQTLGYLSIQLKADKLRENFSRNDHKSQGDYIILDKSNQVFLASSAAYGNLLDGLTPEILSSAIKRGYSVEFMGDREFLLFYAPLKSNEMTLIWICPYEKAEFNALLINRLSLAAIIMILISIIMAILFSRSFFLPLKTLGISMNKVEMKQFKTRIPQKRNDEIGELIQAFNTMAKRLDELHNEVYLAHVKEKEAELIALETQINPHFLYNTLDTIYWMTRLEGSMESAQMIKTLAELFRIALSSGSERIPLRKEVEHLEHYMKIQTMRFKERFAYSFEFDKALGEVSVLKLILQPLVENAIIHGIEKKKDSSCISVTIKEQEGILYYRIFDDGPGYVKPEREKSSSSGYGLKNVDDRLKLAFGEDFGLEIQGIKGKGTTVIVKQPISGADNGCSDS